MTTTLHITHSDDFFEVSVRGNLIVRITKYCGGTNLRKDLQFEELSEAVREKIVSKLQETYE